MRDWAHDAYLFVLNGLLAVPVHRFREAAFRRAGCNSLGRGAILERKVRLTCKGGVAVGARTVVNRGVTLDGRGTLSIGSDVNISIEAMILTADHDPQSPTFAYRVRPTIIGDRAWLAARVLILPGARIGEGAVAAAGAVVRGTVDPWTIVAGNPARVIGQRERHALTEFTGWRRRLLQ